MGRHATLEPTFLRSKAAWYLSVPPLLSQTGKRAQEYFRTKAEAELRAKELKRIKREKDGYAAKANSQLIRDAVECDELAQIYGFSGLREAFMTWSNQFDKQSKAIMFEQLLDAYEGDHSQNWSTTYVSARWKPFRKKMEPLLSEVVTLMDTDFWRQWLGEWREQNDPAPTTYNQILGLLRGLFRHETARAIFAQNPIEPVPALKNIRTEVCVATPPEVQSLLGWAWQNDQDVVPYFAIGFFAGLRPLSELKPLRFSQISISDRLISVVTTKTQRNPRRQVPIEDNLQCWLAPFNNRDGMVCPSNLTKRVNRAKKASGIAWGHDIMRHSYGSYWEAAHRTDAGCRESLSYNMGHSSFKTYEQNYRNDRTSGEADAYWEIVPPTAVVRRLKQ